MVKMSIIIPVWNKSNFTKSCLKDLSRLSVKNIEHEIIVVDNGSTDKTEEVVKSFIVNNAVNEVMEAPFVIYKYIKLKMNHGFSYACNRAYQESTGDVVMFLNNDIRVNSDHSNWTESIFNETLHEKGEPFPPTYLIGPTVAYIDPKTFEFKYENSDYSKKFNYMSAWCIAASRFTWKELETAKGKPFSEDFFCFFEDADLGFRAKQKRIDFSIIDVPLTHFGHITAKQLNVNHLYRKAKKIFTKKWER